MAVFDVISVSSSTRNIKKSIEEKKQELKLLYGFLGMEVYDLNKEGRIDIPDLKEHFNKIREIEDAVSGMETELQRMELRSKGNSLCSCGGMIMADTRFCPKCGKPVETGVVLCDCGKEIKSDMQFCPYCGKSVKEKLSTAESEQYKECICGARISYSQTVCMECGRSI